MPKLFDTFFSVAFRQWFWHINRIKFRTAEIERFFSIFFFYFGQTRRTLLFNCSRRRFRTIKTREKTNYNFLSSSNITFRSRLTSKNRIDCCAQNEEKKKYHLFVDQFNFVFSLFCFFFSLHFFLDFTFLVQFRLLFFFNVISKPINY